jgi:HlyD family secretion protein
MTDTALTEELRRVLAAEEGGRVWLRRLGALGIVAALIGGGLYYRAKHTPPPPARFLTAAASTGDVIEKVQATGTVQPVLQVNVGAQVNGRIMRVNVDFNSVVKRGDVLAEIDPVLYGTQVNRDLASLSVQRASIDSAKANAEALRIALDRTERLFQQNLASKAELDTARGQYEVARAQLTTAQAQLATIEASLAQSKTNVGWTKITSPVDGVVITRSIDPGATVVASFQAPTLFVIAQDLRSMRVLADVDEADVGKLREKMDAEAVVDAFPGEVFKGRVEQIRFSPNNNQGVVTYSAVIDVENPDEKLRPGMTATVTIRTREAKGVVRIPNAALRYKPAPPKGPNDKPIVQAPEPPLPKGQGRVYLLENETPGEEKVQAKIVPTGITDGLFTEIVGGALAVGTKVVTDETDAPGKKKKGF